VCSSDLDYFNQSDSFDYVVATGFSRGAALARRFAAIINDLVGDKKIRGCPR